MGFLPFQEVFLMRNVSKDFRQFSQQTLAIVNASVTFRSMDQMRALAERKGFQTLYSFSYHAASYALKYMRQS